MGQNTTHEQYDLIIDICRKIFLKKTKDYGTAWRILRPESVTDQIMIKAKRIRTLEEKGANKIDEGISSEYIGIINYSIIALIQSKVGMNKETDLNMKDALAYFDEEYQAIKALMEAKNHDYGEAWRDMRRESLTDLILMKLLRIKQIEDNKGLTLISEGVQSGYRDIVNYAVFALIKLEYHQEDDKTSL